ncbi:hypothetical protein DCC62_06495 [candidate division KSB1 bacterium]|nr:MAG: hypothetical protein DCC62_06495 [candidate division KSB1 bacterium]
MGELLAMAVAAISYRVKFLDLSGALATFVLGSFVFGLGGWKFSLPLLAFFVLSSMLSRLGAARKRAANKNFQKCWPMAAFPGCSWCCGILRLNRFGIFYFWAQLPR